MNWRRPLRIINVLLFLVALGIALRYWPNMSWNRPKEPPPPVPERTEAMDWVDPEKGLKIILFYTSTPVVAPGEVATLCYGVANTDQVTLDPPHAGLSPSLNRCVEVKPRTSTSYTLTASNERGEEQSQTVEVQVRGTTPISRPPAPEAEGPRIEYFRAEGTTREGGRTFHKLCFRAWHAEQVSVEPPAFPASKVFQGCFAVAPARQTTFTLTARGADGRTAQARVTVSP